MSECVRFNALSKKQTGVPTSLFHFYFSVISIPPFNENMLRPCPMLENPEILRKLVAETGAKSTDLQSPESAEHLCGKCDKYAACWKDRADQLWDERQKEKAAKAGC